MSNRVFFLLALLAVPLLSACDKKAEMVEPVPSVSQGVAWYQGSVEQAFAAAATQKKSILLYWGAAWPTGAPVTPAS